MIAILLDLTLRGSAAFLLVWLFDSLAARRMQARWRRVWWLLVPVAFLLPIKAPVLPAQAHYENLVPAGLADAVPIDRLAFSMVDPSGEPVASLGIGQIAAAVWFAGLLVSLLLVLIQTLRMARRWAGERFSTDARLLAIVEDCRKLAGVDAPVGLIVAESVEAPAIVGWLRPRILLPLSFAGSGDERRVRHVILHELAHFRFLDVPAGWLFAAACCLHWFNPLAHLAARRWAGFREEAADENAIRWNARESPSAYGETLLSLIREEAAPTAPGVLAIGETFSNLKHRIHMITQHAKRTPKFLLAAALTAVLAAIAAVQAQPAGSGKGADVSAGDPNAAAKQAAVAAMEQWLKTIDEGHYAKSWDESAATFQKALTSQKWVEALTSVRTPLGTCDSRKLASASFQKNVPLPTGGTLNGEFVIAQFETSFADMKYAVETVTFELQDGIWKASGYFIRPR